LFIEWANVQRFGVPFPTVRLFSPPISDLAGHLSVTSSQQMGIANDISVPIESNNFHKQMQGAFAAYLDTPLVYKNFEFDSKRHSQPILFGYPIPNDDTEAERHATHVVNAFYRLLDLSQGYLAIGVPEFHHWYEHQHVRTVSAR
jgi:hypothetical protein